MKGIILGLLLSASFYSFGQSETETETLLKNTKFPENIGFMFSPNYALTTMDESVASLLSFKGGIIINNKFTIGGFYNFSINQINPKSETLPNVYMDYKAGGGFVEYTIYSNKLVHLTFPLYIGV